MTTQDKPAVGPLSAEDWAALADLYTLKGWLHGISMTPDWNDVVADGGVTFSMVIQQEARGMAERVGRVIDTFRLAPTAPDVSTKPLETNTSAEHVKETAKNEHVTAPVEADCGIHGKVPGPICIRCAELGSPMGSTAPVEAGGSERDAVDFLLDRLADFENEISVDVVFRDWNGYVAPAIARVKALRPQPSGETLQSLAQAFEDAMEGSHGAWAVSGDYSPLSATTVADKIQADTDAKLTDCPSGETREAVLKGVGKINGDGWKDTTTEGEIVFVWNAEKPAPYAPGQYPRVGNEGWSASTSQYDFTPATADDVPAIIALLSARPAPVASSDQPEQGALEVVAWPVVTDQWTETYCELTGRDPDGKQVTFVDGATVTTFRDMAKREIEAMLCAAPKAAVRAIAALTPPAEPVSRPVSCAHEAYQGRCAHCGVPIVNGFPKYPAPPAEPVSRPAGEGEREAVARIILEHVSGNDPDELIHYPWQKSWEEPSRPRWTQFEEAADAIIALIRPAAPDGGGLADLAARVTAEVKRGADGSHVQALGALSNIEAMVRAAIPASEGGRG